MLAFIAQKCIVNSSEVFIALNICDWKNKYSDSPVNAQALPSERYRHGNTVNDDRSTMEYYNNTLCISAQELNVVMSRACYDKMVYRRKIQVARPGKGAGNYALVVVDSLPNKYKEKVKELYPNLSTLPLQEWLRANYTLDTEARSYF